VFLSPGRRCCTARRRLPMPVFSAGAAMRTCAKLLMLLLSALTLTGCVIPIPMNKPVRGSRMREDYLAFLHPGVPESTVVARLGQPTIIWDEANLYVYDWEMCDWLLIVAFGYGYSGGVFPVPVDSDHSLLIQFDDQNRVTRFENVTRPPFSAYGDFLRQWVDRPQPATRPSTRPAAPELVTD
jgi:outer membrane protein assembly factor BamE (lipoprotein component of BamABCDE complex)